MPALPARSPLRHWKKNQQVFYIHILCLTSGVHSCSFNSLNATWQLSGIIVVAATAAMVLQLQWHLSLIRTPLRQTKVSFTCCNDCMCVYYSLQVHSRRDEPVSLPTLIPEPSSFRGDILPSHPMKHTPHHHHKTTIHHTLTTNTNTTDIPLVFPQIIQSIS